MKKTIKLILVGTILGVSILTLTACSNSKNEVTKRNEDKYSNSIIHEEEKTKNSIENNTQTENENNKQKETIISKNIDKTPVDYKKDDVYFFVADSKKIKMGDKMGTLSDIKLHLNKTGAEKELAVNGYLIGGDSILNENGKTVFFCTPVNMTKEKVKAADADIGAVRISDSYFKDYNKIEITNGITIGTSIEDIETVFGEPTKKTDETDYNGPVYEYKGGDYKEFSFSFDKQGKVKSIYCKNFMLGANK